MALYLDHTRWPPMMRRVAVTGATRALRCRGWHEVHVGASSTRCWAGQCAGAAGTRTGASGRSSGAAAGRGVVR
eukprot:4484038-Prymnesium_polylepis.1